jgi:hypothetical protein
MTITHSTVTAKANNPSKDVSADAWNAAHAIAPGTIVNADVNAAAAIAQSKLAAINVAGLSGELADDQPPYLSTTHIGATAYVGLSADYNTLAAEFANVWYGDGTADDVQINAAIAYVGGLGGGTIHLAQGSYDIAANITMDQADVILQGEGWDTKLILANSADVHVITIAANNCTVRDLKIDGNNANQTPTNGNGIQITGGVPTKAHVSHVWIHEPHTGVGGSYATQITVDHCFIEEAAGDGINMGHCPACKILYNHLYDIEAQGIYVQGTDTDTTRYDIIGNYVDTCNTENAIYVCDSGLAGQPIGWIVADNFVTGATTAGRAGIKINNGSFGIVANNVCWINERGISIGSSSNTRIVQHVTVNDNIVYKNEGPGIWLGAENGGVTRDLNIHDNLIYDNGDGGGTDDGIFLGDNATDVHLHHNVLEDNNRYGISISATGTSNIIAQYNTFTNNGTGAFLDSSNSATIHSFTMPFIAGTTRLDTAGAAWGYEIDANAEYAVANGRVPRDCQQSVRLLIQANSIILEAHGMELEIVGQGGGDNEAYNAEAIAVASKGSASTNFAANDQVYWLLTASDDADIDDFVGGDLIAIKVLHEAADGDNCATDAVFVSCTVEYV